VTEKLQCVDVQCGIHLMIVLTISLVLLYICTRHRQKCYNSDTVDHNRFYARCVCVIYVLSFTTIDQVSCETLLQVIIV